MDFLRAGSLKIPQLRKITSFQTFLLSSIFFGLCQFLFNNWQNQINDGIVNLPINVSIHKYIMFDQQFMYTPQSVIEILDAWGDDGIRVYYEIQLMDIFMFCTVYRTLLVVITNFFLSLLSPSLDPKAFRSFQYFLLFPMFLTIVDYFEDVFQLLFCIYYQLYNGDVLGSFIWNMIVGIASVFNFIKWVLMGVGLFELAVLLLLVIAYKAKSKPQDNTDKGK